jgi:hypothetical protein
MIKNGMYVDNQWYSHRKIIADYCGTKDRPIVGSIQHGVHISDMKTTIGKHSLAIARHYCWNRATYEMSKENNIKNVIPIGAPFLYLDKMISKRYYPKGTLSFPTHSNPGTDRKFKHEFFIKHIMENYP